MIPCTCCNDAYDTYDEHMHSNNKEGNGDINIKVNINDDNNYDNGMWGGCISPYCRYGYGYGRGWFSRSTPFPWWNSTRVPRGWFPYYNYLTSWYNDYPYYNIY
jgi:hypothetical protein